jgi:hypothetical protein
MKHAFRTYKKDVPRDLIWFEGGTQQIINPVKKVVIGKSRKTQLSSINFF